MPTAPTYLAANVQLVSKRGRYHLRSSSYRTLAVPRTRTTLRDRSFAVAGPRAYRILYDRSPATDSLGNIRKHIYSRPRNRSALWLLIIVCYTNNLPYLLTCVDRARSVRSRTTGSASEDRRSAPSRTRNRAQTTCRVLVYDATPLRRTRNDRRRCVSLHTLLAVRIYSLHVANRCSFSSIIFTYFVSCFPTYPFFFTFSFLTYFPLRIDPLCFEAGCRKRQLHLAVVFCLFCVVVHFFWLVNARFCRVSFFLTKTGDWLGETSPKGPVLCRVSRNTTTQWISH